MHGSGPERVNRAPRWVGAKKGTGPRQGTKKGHRATIGKALKRAPDTPLNPKTSILGPLGTHGAPGKVPGGLYTYSHSAWTP